MKFIAGFVLLAVFFVCTSANCGCLKCCKNLKVVSPPCAPLKVIYRGNPSGGCQRPLPVTVQAPVLPVQPVCVPREYDYKIQALPVYTSNSPYEQHYCQQHQYDIQVQAPVLPQPQPTSCGYLRNLKACADRVVLPAPETYCPHLDHLPVGTIDLLEKCPTVAWSRINRPQYASAPAPVFEPLLPPQEEECNCNCRNYYRYVGGNPRKKRSVPILTEGVKLLVGLLPGVHQTVTRLRLQKARGDVERRVRQMQRGRGLNNRIVQKNLRDVFGPGPRLGMAKDSEIAKHSKMFLEKLEQNARKDVKQTPQANFFENLEKTLIKIQSGVETSKPSFGAQNNQITKHSKVFVDNLQEADVASKKVVVNKPMSKASKAVLLDKLKKLNEEDAKPRRKRSIILGSDEFDMPFFHVRSSEESGETPNLLQQLKRTKKTTVPPSPLLQLIQTPMRLFEHLHEITPVLTKSKKFLHAVAGSFKSKVLDMASNIFGSFHKPALGNLVRPRSKRYILKVVDEEEVQEFLREKLGGLLENQEKKPKKPVKDLEEKLRQLKVEPLRPKVIIDGNGRPFMELHGVKRPIPWGKKAAPKDESEEQDNKDKISSLITKAKARLGDVDKHVEMPVQTIKDTITENLGEIEELVHMDFGEYSRIYDSLLSLDQVKLQVEQDWKLLLMSKRLEDIPSRIALLDKLHDLQDHKDKSQKLIIETLPTANKFMSSKLLKLLIRLQKLQCIIQQTLEDFEDSFKLGLPFDLEKEIKLVDHLDKLHFSKGTRNEMLSALRKSRDSALDNQIQLLENLRKLLEVNSSSKIDAEAKLLWQLRNIDKLQKDAVKEMNERLDDGLKIRKELKIVFDLLRQREKCEKEQRELLEGGEDDGKIVKAKRKLDLKEFLEERKLRGFGGKKKKRE